VSAPQIAAGDRPSGLVQIKESLRRVLRSAVGPLIRGLARLGISPDFITVLGCILSFGAALAFFEGAFRWAALLVAISGVCDILDGELARELGIRSKFGAFLDSTLDRLGEAMTLTGISGFYLLHLLELVHDPTQVFDELQRGLEPEAWARVSLTAVLALIGSFLVSYTRARAEGLGCECKVGWFERPERMVLLIVAGAFGVGRVMPAALLLLTVLSFTTAIQRVIYVWKSTRSGAAEPKTNP
jgi:CDP-diacylglycerol--glycerol-3-phosphate 3-phosphatidyltransferase